MTKAQTGTIFKVKAKHRRVRVGVYACARVRVFVPYKQNGLNCRHVLRVCLGASRRRSGCLEIPLV